MWVLETEIRFSERVLGVPPAESSAQPPSVLVDRNVLSWHELSSNLAHFVHLQESSGTLKNIPPSLMDLV